MRRGAGRGPRAREALALALAAALAGPARAQVPTVDRAVELHVSVTPRVAKLGERLRYVAEVGPHMPGRLRFVPPDSRGAFGWGAMQVSNATQDRGARSRPDSAGWIRTWPSSPGRAELPLQVFVTGTVTVPGLEFEFDDGSGPRRHTMPAIRLTIVPTVAAEDTAADLRPVRGPLAAPWWERVPWPRVLLAVAAVGALLALVLWLARRRRPAPVVAAVPSPPRDPAVEALAELDALRRRLLPAAGRFDEHAFQLTRILRRFLEATAGTTRPGDTTPEVVEHLGLARIAGPELQQVEHLLRFWDRIKFARVPASLDEAVRAEEAVEAYVRRHAAPAPAVPTTAAPTAAAGTGKVA